MNCSKPSPLPPVPNTYIGGVMPGPGIVSIVSVDGVIGGEVTKYTQDGAGQGNSAFLMANSGPLPAAGPTGLVAYLTQVGRNWCMMTPKSCDDISPEASAQKWAAVLVAWLQAAPACAYKAGLTGSVYDNWGKPIDPYSCPPGQSFDFMKGTCVAPECPSGYVRQSSGLPCEPIPATGEQVNPGRTQQTAPTGIVPVQSTPTNYNNGPVITTQGGGSSPVASPGTGGNTQTPFVSANLIPPSTLATAMITQTGLSQATPAQWCALMSAMLGGFNCPSLALSASAPITADVFLNALRQAESAQTAAPAITGGGFQTMGGAGVPAPFPTINSGVTPAAQAAPAAVGLSPVAIFTAAALIVVILLIKKAG